MNRIITTLAAICCLCIATAQTYTLAPIPFQNNTNHQDTVPLYLDDLFSPITPIGFNFEFYGRTYSSLVVGGNGLLSFDTTLAGQVCNWDISALTSATQLSYPNSIMLTYQDIDISISTGRITCSVVGAAPNRQFIVAFNNIRLYESDNTFSNCNGTTPYTGHVILYETTNVIELHIKQKTFCTGWNGGKAIMALIDTNFAHYTVVPNRGLENNWATTNEAWRFTPTAPLSLDSVNYIKGRVYFDANSNCNADSALGQLGIGLLLDSAQYVVTDASGNYSFAVDTGIHTLQIQSPYFKTCNGDASVTTYFGNYGDSAIIDFIDTTQAHLCSSLSVNIGASFLRTCWPGNPATIFYSNNGILSEDSFDILLSLNDSLNITGVQYPYEDLGNNQYLLHIAQPLSSGNTGSIVLNLGTGCSALGTTYCFAATIRSHRTYCSNVSDTTSMECLNLVGSYDPNEKLVAYQDYVNKGYTTYEEIDSTANLLYKINFQNTGTDTAFYVQIIDTLSSYLDPASIKLEAFSHACVMSTDGHTVKFTFNNIILPDSGDNYEASMGWLRFSVHQAIGNNKGTLINNAVDIYFDANEPVRTNTVQNLIPEDTLSVGINSLKEGTAISIVPNPFSSQSHIAITNLENTADISLNLYNVNGEVVQHYKAESNMFTIHRGNLSSGIYYYRLLINNMPQHTGKIAIE